MWPFTTLRGLVCLFWPILNYFAYFGLHLPFLAHCGIKWPIEVPNGLLWSQVAFCSFLWSLYGYEWYFVVLNGKDCFQSTCTCITFSRGHKSKYIPSCLNYQTRRLENQFRRLKLMIILPNFQNTGVPKITQFICPLSHEWPCVEMNEDVCSPYLMADLWMLTLLTLMMFFWIPFFQFFSIWVAFCHLDKICSKIWNTKNRIFWWHQKCGFKIMLLLGDYFFIIFSQKLKGFILKFNM